MSKFSKGHSSDKNWRNSSKSQSSYPLIIANKLTQFQIPNSNTFLKYLAGKLSLLFLQKRYSSKQGDNSDKKKKKEKKKIGQVIFDDECLHGISKLYEGVSKSFEPQAFSPFR